MKVSVLNIIVIIICVCLSGCVSSSGKGFKVNLSPVKLFSSKAAVAKPKSTSEEALDNLKRIELKEKKILPLAEAGNANAQYNLAKLVHNKGEMKYLHYTENNYHKDVKNTQSDELRKEYRRTKNAIKSNAFSESMKWYLKAANQGHIKAQRKLAELSLANNESSIEMRNREAYTWYHKAASKGDLLSMHKIALMRYKGVTGINKNKAEAVELWKHALKRADSVYESAFEAYRKEVNRYLAEYENEQQIQYKKEYDTNPDLFLVQ